jgi:hypothetical protein
MMRVRRVPKQWALEREKHALTTIAYLVVLDLGQNGL